MNSALDKSDFFFFFLFFFLSFFFFCRFFNFAFLFCLFFVGSKNLTSRILILVQCNRDITKS